MAKQQMRKSGSLVIMMLLLCNIITQGSEMLATLRHRADSFYHAENYSQALELYIQGLEQAEAAGDGYNYVACTGYIANIYETFGDHSSSLRYHLKGYKKAAEMNDSSLMSNFLNNIVMGYCRQGDVSLAKKYFSISQTVKPRHHQDIWHYYQLYDEAHILNAEKRFAEAIRKHEQAREYAATHQMDSIYQLYQSSEIGLVYLNSHFYDQAISIAHQCSIQAQQLGSRELLANAYKILAEAYLGKGDEAESDRYRGMYSLLADSVYNMNRFYQLRSKLADYEEQKYSEHISGLTSTINRQWMTLNVVIVVLLVLVLCFVILVYRRLKQPVRDAEHTVTDDLTYHDSGDSNYSSVYGELPSETKAGAVPSAAAGVAAVDLAAGNSAAGNVTTEELNPTPAILKSAPQLSAQQFQLLQTRIADVFNDLQVLSRPEFSIQMLADMVKSNTRYVSYVLNETYRKNFNALLNEMRIGEAARRLRDTEHYGNMTIQAIYEDLGYTNAMTFNRAFKRIMGTTPSLYQRSPQIEASADAKA